MINIVLFHMDYYSENNYDKFPLFEKCYESIKREFKDENIIIFHNVDEIHKMFPQIQADIQCFSEFTKSHSLYHNLDIYRYLLSHYITNMLYIDSDKFIFSNFKTFFYDLINNNPHKDAFFYFTTSTFFSRKRNETIDYLLYKIKNCSNYVNDTTFLSEIDLKSHKSFCEGKFIKKECHYAGTSIAINCKNYFFIEEDSSRYNDSFLKNIYYFFFNKSTIIIFNDIIKFLIDGNIIDYRYTDLISQEDILKTLQIEKTTSTSFKSMYKFFESLSTSKI